MELEGAPAETAGTEPLAAGETRRSLAKRLLGVGLGGAAVALVPQIAGRAGATTPPGTGDTATGGTGDTGDTATTSTTAPPKRPTDADVELLVAIQSVEISAYQLYEPALELDLDTDQRTVIEVIAQSHLAYAQALSGFLGREASNDADEDLVAERSSSFQGDVDSMLQAAYDLESALVATHVGTIAQLIGTDAVNLLASIATVEGRNGTVLAALMGSTDFGELLVDNEADALAPVKG